MSPDRADSSFHAVPVRRLVCLVAAMTGLAGITTGQDPSPSPKPALPTLRKVSDVQLLSQDEAERGYPVVLRGVVTYVNHTARLATARDSSGAILFEPPAPDGGRVPELERGVQIEIRAFTQRGDFAPAIVGDERGPVEIRILSKRNLPRARHLDPDDLSNPVNHSRYVELRGVVRNHSPGPEKHGPGSVSLQISASGGQFDAILPPPGTETVLDELIGAVVSVKGIFIPIATQFHKLVGIRVLVQDWSELQIEDPGRHAFGEIPIRAIASIHKFRPDTRLRQRVQGVVTMDDPQRGFYLADRTGWLWVETSQTDPIWPGVQVQAIGFPTDKNGFPALQNAVFSVIGETNQPKPLSVTAAGALSGIFHGAPVKMQGKVVDHLIQPDTQSLLLVADEHFFEVRLFSDKVNPLPDLPAINSLVEVNGICVNEFRRGARRRGVSLAAVLAGALATNPIVHKSVSFYIHSRRPDNLSVIAPPPFWTTRHVLGALVLIGVALVASVAWIQALRRQVDRQTAFIEDKLERETVMEERTRIARELHDTLEQELAGIQMQLDAAAGNLGTTPAIAADTLDMARTMLRHSRNETRRSVWDLRSTALETGDLKSAFDEVMEMLHGKNSQVRVEIHCAGPRRRLPAKIENNILRIGQEAVNNAVEHARPTLVKIALDYQPDSVTLRVVDDGVGFNLGTANSPADGHFGLTGMRERARKIGGAFAIDSRPDQGTEVTLIVPYSAATPAT